MASPSTVISLGYGSWGDVNELPTLGYGQGQVVVPVIDTRYGTGVANASRTGTGIVNASRTGTGRTNTVTGTGREPN